MAAKAPFAKSLEQVRVEAAAAVRAAQAARPPRSYPMHHGEFEAVGRDGKVLDAVRAKSRKEAAVLFKSRGAFPPGTPFRVRPV